MAVVKLSKNSKQDTNIGISEKNRAQVAEKLSVVLANSYLLMVKTHYYHWNVSGPAFYSLHILFETQYTELFQAVDEIAERIRTLGFVAPGTYKAFADLSDITEDKTLPVSSAEMVKNLVTAHETIAQHIRDVVPALEKSGDAVTVDLLVGRVTVHDKAAWMLRSSL